MADQELPLTLTIAPFPEGFQGNMDEAFQQAYQNTTATVQGSFLTGLILPPGSTLPSSDQGPIAMGGQWYFFDPVTGQYLPQSVVSKTAKNFVRNSCYQIAQQGGTFAAIASGITPTYDMAQARLSASGILGITPAVATPASTDTDLIPAGIRYTVASAYTTLAATDLFAHEHLIEGADLIMLQGEIMSLSFTALASVPGTFSVYLADGARDQSYVANFTISSTQAGSPVRVKINGIPKFPAGAGWSYTEGTTGLYIGVVMALGAQWKTTTPNQWVSGIFCGTANNTNLLAVGNNQLSITGVKLEASPTATFLQVPTFDADYNEVIRYFFTTFAYQSLTTGAPIMGMASAANQVYFMYIFPRRMCKAPTVIPWSTAATPVSGNITDISTGTSTAVATLAAGPKGLYASPTPTAAKADVFACYIRSDARLS